MKLEMKRIYSLVAVGMLLFTTSSCDERLANLNIDPNNSSSASDAQLLTGALGYMSYVQDADLNQYSFLWAQYYTWGIGVALGNSDRFRQEASTNNGNWSRIYASSLEDLKYLRKSSSSSYRGIGKVLTAYNYQILVDHYGDVPFSESLNGAINDGSILTPKYDTGAEVYAGIAAMLDEAIADFEVTNGDVGPDDLMFGGDMGKWRKLAYSLKLKVLMRTSEVSPNSAAIMDLLSKGDFIENEEDIAKVEFSGASGNQNPMWASMERSLGDFYFASNASINVLKSLEDPRIGAFYSKATSGAFTGQYRGIDQGSIDDEPFTASKTEYSLSGEFAVKADNPVYFMTPWEVWFLRAEAEARFGSAAKAENAFINAITSNFTFLNVTGAADYIATLGFASLDKEGMVDAIGIQKWISLNGTQEDEGWIETKRFDRPASRLFTNGIFQTPKVSALAQGVFPATWLYPASEINLNPNAPEQRVITDKVFWDN